MQLGIFRIMQTFFYGSSTVLFALKKQSPFHTEGCFSFRKI